MAMAHAAHAQLSLEQCRAMAVANNVKTRNAKNDVLSAEQQRKQAFTNYFPTVSATGMGFNANKGMAAMTLSPGMELSLMKDGITGGVTAMQPVFAGGRIVNGGLRIRNIRGREHPR